MEQNTFIPSIGGENSPHYNDQSQNFEAPSERLPQDLSASFPRLAEAIAKENAEKELKSGADSNAISSNTDLREQIIEAIKTVYDPEIPVNIYELGLIYEVNIGAENAIDVIMTLTSPGCPAAGMLPGDVEEKVRSVAGTGDVKVEVTFDPPWDQSMMSDEAKLELGFM